MASKIDPAVMKELKKIKKSIDDLEKGKHLPKDLQDTLNSHDYFDQEHEREIEKLAQAVFKEMKPAIDRNVKSINELNKAVFKEMKPEIMKSVDKLKKEVFKEMENKYFKPTAKELKILLR